MTTTTLPTTTVAGVDRARAWTAAALRDVAYSGAVFAWSIAGFTVLVTGAAVTASLLVLVVGVVAWLAFAYAVRWTTAVDRRLAGWQRGKRVEAGYRRPPARGFPARVKTVTKDPQTWRDMGWLGLTSVAGFSLGVAVTAAVGVVAAYLSMPLWFWAVEDPERLHGLTNLGFSVVDTGPEAFGVTAIGLVLAPLALVLARKGASAHAALAARLLGPR